MIYKPLDNVENTIKHQNNSYISLMVDKVFECVNPFIDALNDAKITESDDYADVILGLIKKAEYIALTTRSFALSNTSLSKYIPVSGKPLFDLEYSNSCIHINCLSILPHRKTDNEYFYSIFMGQMKEKAINIPRLKKATIVFNHHYSNDSVTRYDFDNIETKAAIDIIAAFFLEGDSPEYINTYNTSSYGDKAYTEIIIMPQNYFSKWIEKHQNI